MCGCLLQRHLRCERRMCDRLFRRQRVSLADDVSGRRSVPCHMRLAQLSWNHRLSCGVELRHSVHRQRRMHRRGAMRCGKLQRRLRVRNLRQRCRLFRGEFVRHHLRDQQLRLRGDMRHRALRCDVRVGLVQLRDPVRLVVSMQRRLRCVERRVHQPDHLSCGDVRDKHRMQRRRLRLRHVFVTVRG